MRYAVVYDDTMTDVLNKMIGSVLFDLCSRKDLSFLCAYDYGTDRVQTQKVLDFIQSYFDTMNFHRDENTLKHAHGIGNNNEWAVYYDAGEEHQICGYLYVTTGLYGEAYIGVRDLNHNKLRGAELRKRGVRID